MYAQVTQLSERIIAHPKSAQFSELELAVCLIRNLTAEEQNTTTVAGMYSLFLNYIDMYNMYNISPQADSYHNSAI